LKYDLYLIHGKLLILIQLLSCKQNTINFDQNTVLSGSIKFDDHIFEHIYFGCTYILFVRQHFVVCTTLKHKNINRENNNSVDVKTKPI